MQTVSARVKKAINESPLSPTDIANEMNVSYHTINRWSKEGKENFKKSEIKDLSDALHVSYDWLMFGKGGMSDDPNINQIKRSVIEKGESYKGLDQILSNVESKAGSLVHDLQSLLDDLEKIKNVSGKEG